MTMIAAATGAAMTATGGPSPLAENHSTRRTRIGGVEWFAMCQQSSMLANYHINEID
ncbi:Uncharacterised protein [Mycobacteroides abscessus subsp. bolletii]|nr:Uncharacterised protein [Mycobacteroides abscessus subsp. bolletii]